MNQKIHRSISVQIRVGLTRKELWEGEDQGLINCWEVGREKRANDPELARRAENGELPILVFRGGVDPEKNKKGGKKIGTLNYLAEWQGLRGEDLDLDLTKTPTLVCSKSGVKVTFKRV